MMIPLLQLFATNDLKMLDFSSCLQKGKAETAQTLPACAPKVVDSFLLSGSGGDAG